MDQDLHRWLTRAGQYLRAGRFEWPDTPWVGPAVWIVLGLVIGIPIIGFRLVSPFPAQVFPFLPERGVPIMWLLLMGAVCLAARIARVSWPLAALFCWAILRAGMMSFPIRALQLLLLIGLVGLLYGAARELSDRAQRWVTTALLAGIAYEGAFGVLNLMGFYPGMRFVLPDHIGRPMGYLTHPNYWGSFMALGLPLVWARWGLPAALGCYLLIASALSGGPIIAASVGMLLLLWPELTRAWRLVAVSGGAGAVGIVMTLHEWRLSGRREVWQAVWPELLRFPVIGQGLGSWRLLAEDINAGITRRAIEAKVAAGMVLDQATKTTPLSAFATLQAHNEPYQLWFELGLIGLALAGLWGWQAGRAAWRVWWACPAGSVRLWDPGRVPLDRAWVAVLAIGCVNALGSPTFHLPGQAAIMILALARVQAAASLLTDPLLITRAAFIRPEPGTLPRDGHRKKRSAVHAET